MSRLEWNWGNKSLVMLGLAILAVPLVCAAVDAPAGFDNLTNGFTTQAQFDADLATFEEFETIDDGLGPVYNAQSCRECHQNPVTGGPSQVTELRKGRFDGVTFTDPPGGSLNNDRAIDADIQERVAGADNVVAIRSSLNILGDGFVEAIANSTLTNIQASQPAGQRGTLINVPVFEAPGQTRFGRFGHKDQQASLLSFAADAYVNEMGITSPLQPTENTSNGTSVAAFDEVPDPEDATDAANPNGIDVSAFTRFMRSTKVPPRDAAVAATADSQAGANIFNAIGCNICHRTTITTANAGTVINGGAFTVPAALGGKDIHPFSDFMLHNVGTGDGIVQNGGQGSRNQVRTAPLWGMRTHSRLMHDLDTFTRNNAILRHAGQANPVITNYINLSLNQQNQLITFLQSL
jgi:CxxC motif-containing protein (DUF1111 family)